MGKHYNQLDLDERIELSRHHDAGTTPSEIARIMGRHPSTIGRELKRNSLSRNSPAVAVAPMGRYARLLRNATAWPTASERIRASRISAGSYQPVVVLTAILDPLKLVLGKLGIHLAGMLGASGLDIEDVSFFLRHRAVLRAPRYDKQLAWF